MATNLVGRVGLRYFNWGSDVKVMTLDGKFKRTEPATYYPEVKERHALGHKNKKASGR